VRIASRNVGPTRTCAVIDARVPAPGIVREKTGMPKSGAGQRSAAPLIGSGLEKRAGDLQRQKPESRHDGKNRGPHGKHVVK
jgi:hypothetical protein